jgi:hypothetical protein
MVTKNTLDDPTIGIGLDFSAQFLGSRGRVLKMFEKAAKANEEFFKSGDIENQILADIKSRFDEVKKQRDPETGKAWPRLNKITPKRRRKNLGGSKLKLLDTGSLRDKLGVRKKGLKKTTDTRTGTSTIGYTPAARSKSSPQFTLNSIAADHHLGVIHANGRVLPPRPFLGVSKKEAKGIEKLWKLRIETELIEFI